MRDKDGAFSYCVCFTKGKRDGVHKNGNLSTQEGGGESHDNANVRIKHFPIKDLVHTVLAIVTIFFVSFI